MFVKRNDDCRPRWIKEDRCTRIYAQIVFRETSILHQDALIGFLSGKEGNIQVLKNFSLTKGRNTFF